jgi:hypothetical protein
MAGTVVQWTHDTLTPGLAVSTATLHKRLDTFMAFQESKVQDYMRTNAPWTDQTGNARNGLFAKASEGDPVHNIVCYHTMPYGIFLEVRFNGTYAIITPTILNEGERIMAALHKFLDNLGSVA